MLLGGTWRRRLPRRLNRTVHPAAKAVKPLCWPVASEWLPPVAAGWMCHPTARTRIDALLL